MAKSMSWRVRGGHPDFEHIAEAFRQLKSEATPDRAVGVIGGAIIEVYLTEALIAHLHKNEKITKDLFSPTGAIGNFAPKCDLAFLTGLVSKATHRDLRTIVDIRNAFAHKLSIKDFRAQKVAHLARNLAITELRSCDRRDEEGSGAEWKIKVDDRGAALKDPRSRFLIAVHVFTHGFLLAQNSPMPTPRF